MGETEEGADKLDDQVWGSDEEPEQEDEENEKNEETGENKKNINICFILKKKVEF